MNSVFPYELLRSSSTTPLLADPLILYTTMFGFSREELYSLFVGFTSEVDVSASCVSIEYS